MKSTDQMKPVYNRLFKTRDGELVFEDIMNRFFNNPIKDETLVRQVGQRDVALYIKRMTGERNG